MRTALAVVVGAVGGFVVGLIVGIAVPNSVVAVGVLPVLGLSLGGWAGFYRSRAGGAR